jgi:hypothetical protein
MVSSLTVAYRRRWRLPGATAVGDGRGRLAGRLAGLGSDATSDCPRHRPNDVGDNQRLVHRGPHHDCVSLESLRQRVCLGRDKRRR